MIRIEEAEQQRDGDGIDVHVAQRVDQAGNLAFCQSCHHRSVRADAFGDLQASAARDQDVRAVLE